MLYNPTRIVFYTIVFMQLCRVITLLNEANL